MPSTQGISIPEGVGRLSKLEKLANVETNGNGKIIRDIRNLTRLRRLGIWGLTRENGSDICYSLENLINLTTVYMISTSPTEPLHLDSLSSPSWFLQRMYIKSRLASLPNWLTTLNCLSKLVLQYSDLDDDPLRALQVLPYLVHLELREAYAGEEVQCDVEGFPRLKKLVLLGLRRLKRVHVEQGAMPELVALDLTSCRLMESVHLGIKHLKALEDLRCFDMSAKFRSNLEKTDGEQLKFVNILSTHMCQKI